MKEKQYKPMPDGGRLHSKMQDSVKSEPKVSIIIPVYKREQYLSECFNSALWQTLQDIEIIIVDKGENDDARMLINDIERQDSRVVAPHIKNNGYGASGNIGLDLARGEYILILESDDYIEPDACEKLYDYAKKFDADIVKTPFTEMFNDGRFQECFYRKQMVSLLPSNRCFSVKEFGELLGIHASIWSCLYKRKYLADNHIRFVEADGAGYVDVGFRIDTLIHTEKIVWLDYAFYNYRINSTDSSTNNWNISVMNRRWLEVHEKFAASQEMQQDYDDIYGPYLLADEYLNTVYRGELSPFSEQEQKEVEKNLSYIKEATIQRAHGLTKEQKSMLLKAKRKSAIKMLQGKPKDTQDLPDVKIFAAFHSEENVVIDNPVYIPILGGAKFNATKNTSMLRDDIGDNISEKNKSFCELTVQYWAWKNADADYYGLCHYRRYIDFSDKKSGPIDDHGQLIEASHLTMDIAKKYGLTDEAAIRKSVSNYDAIIIKPADITQIPTPTGYHQNIYDFWAKGAINLLEPNVVDKTLDLILKLHPEYYESAIEYLQQKQHRGYNTFILRKDLFFQLCQFEFDIIFALEKMLTPEHHSKLMYRMPGYIGEILSGVFFYFLEHQSKYKVTSKQLVHFANCKKEHCELLKPAFTNNYVPVVFTSSRENVPYLGICLQMLKETISPGHCYDVIVLETDFDAEDKHKLSKIFANVDNVKLRFYNPFQMIAQQNIVINVEGYVPLQYYKELLPWILPLYSTAIVLDTDIVIKRDVAELMPVEWGDKCVAGVRDTVMMGLINGAEEGWREHLEKTLKMQDIYGFINGGVLLFNLEKIRKTMVAEKVMAVAMRNDLRTADQDVLNTVYQGKIHFLDSRWNLFVKTNWWVAAGIEHAPREDANAYECAEKEPYIIHFANKPKPWQDLNMPFSEDWWEAARKSPFYEIVFEKFIMRNFYQPASAPLSPPPGPYYSKARKWADKIMPKGTRRREFAKKLLPKDSRRWNFCKKIYYFIFRG